MVELIGRGAVVPRAGLLVVGYCNRDGRAPDWLQAMIIFLIVFDLGILLRCVIFRHTCLIRDRLIVTP